MLFNLYNLQPPFREILVERLYPTILLQSEELNTPDLTPTLDIETLQRLFEVNYLQQLFLQLQKLVATFGLQLILAFVILYIGLRVAKFLRKTTRQLMKKAGVDDTVISFAVNISYFGSITFVIVIFLGQIGIQTTAIIAALTSAFFAVGLALQGSLSNFAAGVLIIIFRPFRVKDYIEGDGMEGFVEEIHILTTHLRTLQNFIVVIPNSKLTNDKIINYSAKPYRRIDMVFGVSYGDNLDKVRRIIQEVVATEERVLKEPPPFIGVLELADSSVNFAVRPYVVQEDYWPVWFSLTEKIKKRFDEENVSIPFPQRDIHIKS